MAEEKKVLIPNVEFFGAMEALFREQYQVKFTVTGNSMWPLIRHGRDCVIVEACDPASLQKGDILLFHAAEQIYLLHRVTSLTEAYFETTGDGNCFRDGYFPREAVVARVVKVVRNGKVLDVSRFTVKAAARLWMALYPVRGSLIRGWRRMRRLL